MKSISRPVIFIGTGRSGTTIMSEIIFRHESLAWPSNYQERYPAIPEINLLRNVFENKLWRLQGQKKQLNKVSAINKVLFKPAEAYKFWEYLTGPQINFSRGFLINDTATPEEAKKIRTAFSKLVSYQLKQRLAFKITGPSRIGYLKSIFPDAIFINVVREPLPTINSWLNVEFWQEKGKHQLWWTGAYTKEEEEWAKQNAGKPELLAAMQYKKLMDVTAMEIERHNADCLRVDYEDFVANPVSVIESITNFAGLSKSQLVDEYLQHNKIYNQNENEKKADTTSNERYGNHQVHLILKGEYAIAGNR
jgi:hypothetical protein